MLTFPARGSRCLPTFDQGRWCAPPSAVLEGPCPGVAGASPEEAGRDALKMVEGRYGAGSPQTS
jgi:hypothetical protein